MDELFFFFVLEVKCSLLYLFFAHELTVKKIKLQLKYEEFQQNVEHAGESGKINGNVVPDRASLIKVF